MLQTKERIVFVEPQPKQAAKALGMSQYIEDHFKKPEIKQELTESQRKELVLKLIDFVKTF